MRILILLHVVYMIKQVFLSNAPRHTLLKADNLFVKKVLQTFGFFENATLEVFTGLR